MRKLISFIAILYFIVSCGTTSALYGFKRISYTSFFQIASSSSPFEKRTFNAFLPKGYKIEKEDFNPEYKEIVYNYPNGIKLYITDNKLNGSSLNGDNKLNQNITLVKRESLNDSVYMKGKQQNGQYWREDILNEIAIGYLNVPKSRKEEFDKAIATIIRK